MAEINSGSNGNHLGIVLNVKEDVSNHNPHPSSATKSNQDSALSFSVPFMQKLLAELVGTYFLIFAGCASVVVNLNYDTKVTLPGISIVWGLAVTVLVYSVGHISGAHFNPAVTIAYATCRRFPWKQVSFQFNVDNVNLTRIHLSHEEIGELYKPNSSVFGCSASNCGNNKKIVLFLKMISCPK